MAVVNLAVVIFLLDNLREKRGAARTKPSGISRSRNSCGALVENRQGKNRRQ